MLECFNHSRMRMHEWYVWFILCSILIHFSRRTFELAASYFGSQVPFLYRLMTPRSLVAPSRSSSFLPRILLLGILGLRLLGICAPKQSSLQKLLHYPIRLCRLRTEPLIAYPLPHCLFRRCVVPRVKRLNICNPP